MQFHLRRFSLISLMLMPFFSLAKNDADTMRAEEVFLKISVKCKNFEEFLHKKSNELLLQIKIENVSKYGIGIPLEFIKKAGPSISLQDIKTSATSYLKTNIANPELKKDMTVLHPNKFTTIEWVIFDEEIRQFNSLKIDVVANILLSMPILINGKINDYSGTSSLHIIEK